MLKIRASTWPTVKTIPITSLIIENLDVEETLDGTSQPYYLTGREVRPKKVKWRAQDQKEAGLELRWLDSKSRVLFPL